MGDLDEVQEQMKADMSALKEQMDSMMDAMLGMKQLMENPKNISVITLRSRKQYQGPQLVASSSSVNEPAQHHSTPEKDDEKNLKSKLPNNFYAGESSTGNSNLQQ